EGNGHRRVPPHQSRSEDLQWDLMALAGAHLRHGDKWLSGPDGPDQLDGLLQRCHPYFLVEPLREAAVSLKGGVTAAGQVEVAEVELQHVLGQWIAFQDRGQVLTGLVVATALLQEYGSAQSSFAVNVAEILPLLRHPAVEADRVVHGEASEEV